MMGHATRILFVVSLATLMLPDTVHAQGQREGRGAPPAQAPGPQAPRGGGIRGRVDPRVQQRTYLFKDTNEELPYALFVSSKVSKNKKNPLIVALHGLGGDQNTMVRESFRAVELAEDGGYILVAPMGYNSGGWYGIPVGAPRGNRGPGDGTNPAATPPRGNGAGRGFNPTAGGTAVKDPAKVRELSEKDVMNVLDMIRKEFNVDERRTYLMGHSMGGAGTLYLGVGVCVELGRDRRDRPCGIRSESRHASDDQRHACYHRSGRCGYCCSRREYAEMGGQTKGIEYDARIP